MSALSVFVFTVKQKTCIAIEQTFKYLFDFHLEFDLSTKNVSG